MKKIISLFTFVLLSLSICHFAYADLYAYDGNWSIYADYDYGMTEWNDPDGNNHMYEQLWYFQEASMDDEAYLLDDSDFTLIDESNPAGNSILQSYEGWEDEIADLWVDLYFKLDGPNDSYSRIFERLTVTNKGNEAITLSIFEYDDFDLDDYEQNTAKGDTSSIVQHGDNGTTAKVTPISSIPDSFEITAWSDTQDNIKSGLGLSGTGSPFGPDDATFAFQWSDITIFAGESFEITKTKELWLDSTYDEPVPEPATMLLLGSGLLGLFGMKFRKKSKA